MALDRADQRAEQAASSDEAGVEIAAVRTEVHAGQRDLLEAGGGDAPDLGDDLSTRARCAAARVVVGMMQ